MSGSRLVYEPTGGKLIFAPSSGKLVYSGPPSGVCPVDRPYFVRVNWTGHVAVNTGAPYYTTLYWYNNYSGTYRIAKDFHSCSWNISSGPYIECTLMAESGQDPYWYVGFGVISMLVRFTMRYKKASGSYFGSYSTYLGLFDVDNPNGCSIVNTISDVEVVPEV